MGRLSSLLSVILTEVCETSAATVMAAIADAPSAVHRSAEVIEWEKLLEAGSLAAARQKGTLRLEGKEYVVHDGEIVHIRHSG